MPGFFDTIGAPLVSGRDFSEADAAAGYRVAVITAGLERALWPDGAVGRRLAIGQSDEAFEIIGVVGDMTPIDPRMGETPFVFTPLLQNPGFSRVAVLNVRTARPLDASALLEVVEAGGQYTIYNMTSMNERTSRALASEKVTASLGTAFGALALLIAATGLASMLAYLVEGRRREFGVKLALGAEPGRLMRSVVGEAAVLFVTGIALGVPLAAGASRLIGTFVINVGLGDPAAVSGSALLLLAVALAAAALPALRAARTNPLDALRAD
jgi:ABC-type lipoprotein release transport system permease subunit